MATNIVNNFTIESHKIVDVCQKVRLMDKILHHFVAVRVSCDPRAPSLTLGRVSCENEKKTPLKARNPTPPGASPIADIECGGTGVAI